MKTIILLYCISKNRKRDDENSPLLFLSTRESFSLMLSAGVENRSAVLERGWERSGSAEQHAVQWDMRPDWVTVPEYQPACTHTENTERQWWAEQVILMTAGPPCERVMVSRWNYAMNDRNLQVPWHSDSYSYSYPINSLLTVSLK